ncbi:hypothetical protein SAMN05428949_1033 [Chitinophaga sp. YR627]|uniref:hypothetical protein n=1 Tax=Chitinophaga sp. YR627 TaxID=1881041 RepID=UPI0008E20ADE|nr:hypothetical protein [Chitinophaga sp. YR627]SFM85059.1 hypothetical protein SAMN05428949_1033 [Chitinophaga sp. YR627]
MLKYTCTILLIISMISHACGQLHTNTGSASAQKAFASNETADKYRKNWRTERLHGKVKTIVEFSYNGPATDTTDPDVDTRASFHFAITGNLIAQTTQREGTAQSHTGYKYNKDNKWTEMSCESEDGVTDYTNYNIFDKNGWLIEEGERYADGSTSNKLVSVYDQSGDVIKTTIAGLVTDFKNTYDKAGLLISRQAFEKGRHSATTTWKYDSVGHIIEKVEYAADGSLLSKTTTAFNKFHLPDSMSIIKKGYNDNIQWFRYDSAGHEISQGQKDPKTAVWVPQWTFSYEWDAQGNWTKCITYNDSKEVVITTIRKIIYY